MNSILIFATCLVIASAAVLDQSRTLSQVAQEHRPTRCCLPKNWQSYIGETVFFQSGAMDDLLDYAVKSDERQVAFRILDRFSHVEQSRIVLDFNTNTMYNITSGMCVKSVKSPWFEEPLQCLPSNAQYVGDYFVGGESDGWQASYWKAHNVSKLISYLEIGFSKNCFPVYENLNKQLMFNAGVPIHIVANFANFADHIKDPEIFNVPASCNNRVPKDFVTGHHPRS